MKEITTYEAFDGTRFDSYNDCYDYELSLSGAPFFDGGVVFFNGKMEHPTIITKNGNVSDFLRDYEEYACYIRFANKDSVEPFIEFINDNGLCMVLDPHEEEKEFIPGDIYEYGEDDYWHNYSKKLREQVEAEKRMREWGK